MEGSEGFIQDVAQESVVSKDAFEDLKEKGVRIEIYEDMINIDPGSDVYFKASPDENRNLKLWIKTVRDNGQRAPYFERHKATDLARRAIKYFDQYGELKGIAFDWGRPPSSDESSRSDNYLTYLLTRDQLSQRLPLEEGRIKAVQATWTYNQIASPNGFNTLTKIEEVGDANNPVTIRGVISREKYATPTPSKTE